MKGLQKLRESFGYERKELAEETGLSPSEICYLESGKIEDPRLSTLLALSTAFDMNLEALLDNIQ